VEWPTWTAVLQVEVLHELGQVVGVGIEVIAVPRLARAAVAAPVVRDAAKAARGEIEHLVSNASRKAASRG